MANHVSHRMSERLPDASFLACLTETPLRTGAIAMRLGLTDQRLAVRLRKMPGVLLVMKGRQNTWRLKS